MRSITRFWLGIALLVVTVAFRLPAASAQVVLSQITGVVRDASRAELPAARIEITHEATAEHTTVIAGPHGEYTLLNLRPGRFTLSVSRPGFRRYVQSGIQLSAGERIRLDVEMVVGGVEDEVRVDATASLLRTESGSLGQLIANRSIVNLPLNGRNFFSLITLVPGIAAPPPTSSGPSFPRINGGRPRVNEYLFDGISALQPEPGQVAFNPVIDAIQEFKIEINSPPAEYGRFNGGVINLTTKSGSSDFHGSIFEFFRNEALNARNLFAPATVANPGKPLFRRSQHGFTTGGPIRHGRSFFFGDFQGTRQSIGRVLTSTVPTTAQRNGDFSANLGALLYLQNGSTATTSNTGVPINVIDTNGNLVQARSGQIFKRSADGDRRAYAGNIIPVADFDPTAARLLSRYPLPTSAGLANNYRRIANERLSQDQFDVRLDHHFTQHDQVFGRYSFFRESAFPVTPLPEGSGSISQGATALQYTGAHQVAGSFQHTFSPSVVNELRFGYTRRSVNRLAGLLGTDSFQSFWLKGIPRNSAFGNELPTFTIAGLQQLGPSANTDSIFNTSMTQVLETLTWQHFHHTLKFGADLRFERLNVLQPPSPTGTFGFTAPFTSSRGTANTLSGGANTGTVLAGQTGNALASFLLGQVNNFSIDLQQGTIRPRARIAEFFVQDDFRVTSRLTVNAGLRYTLNFPSTEASNQGAIFNLQTQQLEYLGKDGFPETARQLHKLNLGPRLALAYRVADRTVLRAGYGLIWQEQAGITTPFTIPQFPFIQTVSQRSLDGISPAFILANGPGVQPIPLKANAGLGQGVFAVDRDLGSGYVQQWNLAIQREVTTNLVAEIAYAGSKVTHVGIPDTNINQLTLAQLGLGNALLQQVPNPYYGEIPASSSIGDPTIAQAQLLRPFPRFTTVSLYRNNVGNTSYHALQAKLEKRLSRGISVLASYTRSKLIDDAGSVFDASILTGPVANYPVADSFNRALEKGVSTGDIPNVFVTSITYDIPSGRRAKQILAGWSVNGLIVLQSGMPFPVTQITNFNSFAGFGTQRPNLLRNPDLPGDARSTDRWFDTSAFAVAPQFTIGTSSRNPVRGPGYRTADIALIKRTSIGESRNLEFRTEVFNLTNTPPLGNPNGVLGNVAFGTITSSGDPRIIQFALKLNF